MSRTLCLLLAPLLAYSASAQSTVGLSKKRIQTLLANCSEARQFNGVALVAEEGKVIFKGGFGFSNLEWKTPNTIDTRFEIASMTKAMTAVAILRLSEQGKIRLTDHISDHLTSYPKENGERITIQQLLTHTSGLQQDIAFPDGNEVPSIVAKLNADLISLEEMVKMISARPLRFEPGASFAYSSDGYAILGAIIQQVTKQDYYRAMQQLVFNPLRMADTQPAFLTPLIPKRAMGYRQTYGGTTNADHIGASPAGGFYSTLDDLFRFDQALYGDSLLNPTSRKLLFSQRSIITAYGWKTSIEKVGGKNLDVFRTSGGLPGFVHVLVRVPAKRRTIILLSNKRGPAYYLDAITRSINQILDGEKVDVPKKSLAEALAEDFAKAGSTQFETNYKRLQPKTDKYYTDEPELNSLAYFVLATKGPKLALPIFKSITETFPKSSNAFDSLGEAYMLADRKPEAIANYEKSLELNPKNDNAVQMLKKLRGN